MVEVVHPLIMGALLVIIKLDHILRLDVKYVDVQGIQHLHVLKWNTIIKLKIFLSPLLAMKVNQDPNWYIDTGAANHVTSSNTSLTNRFGSHL